DGELKNMMTYEIIEPETVGHTSYTLVLRTHSGWHAFRDKLNDLGYDLSKEEVDNLFIKMKELADKKKDLLDEDIDALVAEEYLRVPDIYKLDYLNVVSGTVTIPTATVILVIEGEKTQSSGFGVGPIDATFNTIAKMTGTKSNLARFSVNSITGGLDAQGEVTVRLQENDILALGKGTDPDIITAAAKAYINGLNRIRYLKRNPSIDAQERSL
ncbi:MAG: 2-isopropylmalate synthase, partial [Deltaproteobacteria bacterium]|nr:2-isopropylmalate synthase [Deltaproteobacteria bacterium]